MTEALQKLLDLGQATNRFDVPYSDIADAQLAALNERFDARRGQIKLLAHRAKQGDITRLSTLDDAVAVLFPHTAYKSYPESFLVNEKWDRLTKWLNTVSSYVIEPVDPDNVDDIDDWVRQLGQRGHFLSCSSGTTGKSAMLIASEKDMAWSKKDTVGVFSWGSGVPPRQDRKIIGCAPVADVPKNRAVADAQYEAYANPEWARFDYPVPPITIGALTHAVTMRKKIADGTARPEEITQFENTSKSRQEIVDSAIEKTADEIIANREKKLMVAGLWSGLYAVAKVVRDKGYSAKDFNPDNCIYVGGGLKRAQLPDDYQEFVHATFNIPEGRHFQNYSMQELNSGMPKCEKGGRYHVPPWVVPLVLNKEGDALVPHDGKSEIEGRAAFFDLSLDGRWGGVISGDRISLDYGPCACGAASPSVRDDIVRYADLEGDDKIGCAGTVDAYVRGAA